MSHPVATGRRRARPRLPLALAATCVLLLCACADEPRGEPAAPGAGSAVTDGAAAGSRDTAAWFANVTASSGLAFTHDAGATPEKHLPETMGGGAALFDFDADGDLDVYLVQSGPMRVAGPTPGSFADPPGELLPNRLFANVGGGRFDDVTAASAAAADTGYGQGVVCGDVDGDGHLDLFVTNLGPDKLLLGDGRGGFSDATSRSPGLAGNAWSGGASLFDADNDGDLDLYVVHYVAIDVSEPEWCGDRKPGWRSFCHPDSYAGVSDHFWRNRGDGTFEDHTQSAGLSDSAGKGLGALAADFDDDGDLDLYVANDSVENRLWWNDGRGHFEDATLLSGTGVNRHGSTEAGMGLAAADVDGDLDLDLIVTNFDNESNTLYENEGRGLFADRTVQFGLEAASRLPVGFGVVFSDFDEDGDPDLAVANGHIIDNIQLYHDGKTHAQRAALFENQGGRFHDRTAQGGGLTAQSFVGRGLYAGDLDGDGDPDLLLTQCGGPAVLLENLRGGRHGLRIEGLPAGTRIEARTTGGRVLALESGPQPSYFGQSAPAVHIGLGEDALQNLRWRPLASGDWSELVFEPARGPGRLVLVEQPDGSWSPTDRQ